MKPLDPKQSFDTWNQQKQIIHQKTTKPSFKEGKIWWCSVGRNIGREVYGKWTVFSRPVYVYRKLSKDLFFGIPLTSRKKEWSWFYQLDSQDMTRWLLLAQMRSFDSVRLHQEIILVSETQQKAIHETVAKFLRL